MENKECPLCKEELVSEASLGCMMCGMPIEDGEFCSMKCEELYEEIHKDDEFKKRK